MSLLGEGIHIDEEATDAELITRYRAGDDSAATDLFTRHHGPAVRFASGIAGRSSADDLAAEAFTQVLAAIRKGRGPDVSFRAYLITSVRHAYINSSKRDSKISWVDDYENFGTLAAAADESGLRSESTLLAQAFATLPERWQTVLWHTSVEDDSTADVGRLLGISPSAVAALAYRAREGLRQAYLSAHVAVADNPSCQEVREKLAAYSRGQLAARDKQAIEQHLDDCAACSAVLADLRSITSDLPALLIPALLGSAGAAIQGHRPRKRNQQQEALGRTFGQGGRAGYGGRAGLVRSALSGTRTVRAIAVVAAAAVVCVAVVVVIGTSDAPDSDRVPVAGLGGGETLSLVEPPDPPVEPPVEEVEQLPDEPVIEPPAPERKPTKKPKPPPVVEPEPEPEGTTFDLTVALANVQDLGDDMSFDLVASSPGVESTLLLDVTTAGGWNFSDAPPAGADCSAPSGDTPVQVTCVLAPDFAGTLSFLLLGTGGTKAFTATMTAVDNTDPTPGDAAVSYSAP